MKPWMTAHHGHIQAAEKACAAISDYADFIPVCESAPLPAFNAIELTVDPAVDGLRISVGECCGDSQHILLTGRDETHLLYAVSDFRNLYLPQARNAGEHQPVYYLRDLFNVPFPPYEHVSRARIARRNRLARAAQMHMHIDEARHEIRPGQVEDLGTCRRLRNSARPHPRDDTALNGHGPVGLRLHMLRTIQDGRIDKQRGTIGRRHIELLPHD